MSGSNGFTPVQKRLLEVLKDGMPHTREELHACLPDELSSLGAIKPHLSNIRQKIRLYGEDIVCEYYKRTIHYRHVRLLTSPYDGRD